MTEEKKPSEGRRAWATFTSRTTTPRPTASCSGRSRKRGGRAGPHRRPYRPRQAARGGDPGRGAARLLDPGRRRARQPRLRMRPRGRDHGDHQRRRASTSSTAPRIEIDGVGFVGVKGFAGGFGRRMLGAFGEAAIKTFVAETMNEAMRLENAMRAVQGQRAPSWSCITRPIAETVEGEPLEIFPFLGSSRLAETIDRFKVSAVVHGHAHRGRYEGRTPGGAPVYNVALSHRETDGTALCPHRGVSAPLAFRAGATSLYETLEHAAEKWTPLFGRTACSTPWN